jgi:putative ABC transport system permease protein
VFVSAVWVGLLALANVRERRVEIGILRAVGKGSGAIAGLFLGKAVLMGLLGAAVGVGVGVLATRLIGAAALGVGPDQVAARPEVLLAGLLGAPLLAAVASYLPTLSAVTQDPAVVLRDQ